MDWNDMLQSGISNEIREKIEGAVAACKKDPAILAALKEEPGAVLEKLGIHADADQISKIVDMIKAGVTADKAGDTLEKLGDAAGALKGLFGKP